MRHLRDDDGNKIVVSDPRNMEVGSPYVFAYGSGKGSAHVVALMKYPDGSAKLWESSTGRGSRSGPRIRNYRSVSSFLTERGILRGNRIRKSPVLAPVYKMQEIAKAKKQA